MIRFDWLFAAITLPSVAWAQAPPVYKEIGDWIVGCDNTRACVAKAVPDEAGESAAQAGYVRVERGAGPTAAPMVWIGAENRFTPRVSLDGRPMTATWTAAEEGFVLKSGAATAFLRSIRNGKQLILAGRKDGPAVSLKGLAAVLLAVDDIQGRIGNVTALARPGAAPASAVPGPPAAPVLHAAPKAPPLTGAKALIGAVRRSQAAVLKTNDCDAGEEERGADAAQPLSRDEAIVFIGCITGAYQGSQLAFRVPRAAPQRAKLLIMPKPPVLPKEEQEDGFYTEADYDADKASFVTVAKGRGLADCGVSMGWVFDGAVFRLSDLTYQNRCGGGTPGDWPVLYRTRTTR
jgi:hypothetical protein